ncbi:TetR/AcrR family transcriptional regulator [Nocardia brevicatena]|uniref:TetR/AcrR family transcriptional regulator n=1 Tax=Nocardia brevicatena TaxID=37327 RepID=UPI000307D002|nr:TetR/AcrR family transcriptional regulator [Nocardia brevicatena]
MPNEPGSGAPRRADARRNRARILAAADQVFSDEGAAGSTEEIARRAGVSVGTVFRHFPTKQELLAAIIKDLRQRLEDEAARLAHDGDPATALFAFFSQLVAGAAEKKTIVELLAGIGTAVPVDTAITGFADTLARLLAQAQAAGTVRDDITDDDVIALLTSATRGAVRGGWDPHRQQRVLSIIFAGLAAPAARYTAPS